MCAIEHDLVVVSVCSHTKCHPKRVKLEQNYSFPTATQLPITLVLSLSLRFEERASLTLDVKMLWYAAR